MSNEDQTLLSQARQSTKYELAARRKTQRERLQAFWSESSDLIKSFARECIPDSYTVGKVSDCEIALQNIRKKLLRCKAQTREGFLSWAIKQLAKEPHFHLVAGAIKRFDLEISNWVDAAKLRHTRYTDFPEHCKDGDLYRVKMSEHDGVPIVWTVPSNFWEFVKRIWPVTLKQRADGSHFIAKQIAGQTIPAHRLILACEPGDTVQSSSGNFLDWTSLYVRPLNRSGLYAGRRTSWNKEEKRPNTVQEEFEHRFQSTEVLKNYGTNQDNTERFVLRSLTPVNSDLAATATCWGEISATGWSAPITRFERDQQYAPERHTPRIKQSARLLAAAEALTALGL